jgi:hypothetical protein
VQFDNARAEENISKNMRKELNGKYKELDNKLYEI